MRCISFIHMDNGKFVIRSSREAQAFQIRLAQHRKRRCGDHDLIQPGFFRDLFSYAHGERVDRLFVAVYDLELTFLFMEIDTCSAAGVHNLQFAPGRPYEDSVPLLDDGTFAGKMDTLQHLTAFALRCRAFWDKVMGVLVLLCDPANYEYFAKASSRKRCFAKYAAVWPDPPPHLLRFLEDPNFRGLDPNPRFPQILERVMEHLEAIRTAEAHGTGTLRKSTLGTGPFGGSGHAPLLAHWNIAHGTMRALRRTIDDRVSNINRNFLS